MNRILSIALVIFVFMPLVYAPILGIIFTVLWAISAIVTFVPNAASAAMLPWLIGFSVAWGVLALFTAFVYFTFEYRESGASFFREMSPWAYILSKGWGNTEMVLASLLWPYTWYFFDHNMRGWGFSFGDVVIQSFGFWFVEKKQGLEMISIDLQTGESRTTRVATPQEAAEGIRQMLSGIDDH